MGNSKITLKGEKELLAKFKQLTSAAQGSNLLKATQAGILPIQNAAIEKAPKDTGNLSRSIHTETVESSNTYAESATGTDVEYAARLEFGFMQADRLGRHYNQPAQPYMRPAYDEQKGAVEKETGNALRDLINAVV